MSKQAPLAGLKVVDLTHFVAGPYCTMVLGDLGCEVIKIEKPERGDTTRHMNVARKFAPGIPNVGGDYYLAINRNKRSLSLELKTKEGIAIARELCASADILVQNFRPGVMKRLGLDYETLKKANPRLIYANISAYGDTGPLSDKPGMDVAVQARSGVMSITGDDRAGEPLRPGASLGDFAGGIYLVTAIMTALYHRERTGDGQEISVSLIDSIMSQLINYSVAVLDGGATIKPVGSGHATVVPYQAFPSSDGYVVIAAAANKIYQSMCNVLGCPELGTDPRFVTNHDRVKHREVLVPMLCERTRQHTAKALIDLLEAAGIPCAPVNDLKTAYLELGENSPGMVQEVPHPKLGSLHQLGVPFKFGACDTAITRHPPMLGEHTEEILRELGRSADDIEALRKAGAV